ncbi:hypothetical protein [Anaeromicropila populeti]|uniref:Uncharacterized protein n=1 Tax=Anaeromicropila populeti TaxID=37658 RepID=A0A1I6LR05_9FIRM|nr:hypothetical protein [Anaeromicropila populeti]SFS05863.1 hypothetical protein SAMN05661086_03491 [Anaeromicropila populeti]
MEIMVTGKDRKQVVKVIAEHLGDTSVYLGPPSFAYKIGKITVDRNNRILIEDAEKGKEVKRILEKKGMLDEEEKTLIKIPIENMTAQGIINLVNMLHSKQYLINKAIGKTGFLIKNELIEALEKQEFTKKEEVVSFLQKVADSGVGVSFTEEGILFTGFPFSQEPVKVKAYCELSAMMVAYARQHQRIRSKPTKEENEKYYMRVWLVRIGLGGKGGKETRRELLKNLNGHTAFSNQQEKMKWQERQKAKKDAERASHCKG